MKRNSKKKEGKFFNARVHNLRLKISIICMDCSIIQRISQYDQVDRINL